MEEIRYRSEYPEGSRLEHCDPLQIRQANEDGSPAIISRKIALAQPDEEFRYIVVTVGKGLLNIQIEGLPDGLAYSDEGPRFDLQIDDDNPDQVATTGIISGRYESSKEHIFTVTASNETGSVTEQVTIQPHTLLAPTPPMGWLSWEFHREDVSQDKMIEIIDGMEKAGLAKHGWKYVTVDICWQGERVPGQPLKPNDKFPDVKALSDYTSSKGFVFGMYTAPWTKAYFELEGSGHYEAIDVQQFVDWNTGYLKLDYRPWEVRQLSIWHDLLRNSGKDIVFAFSNHGLVDYGGDYLSDICEVWRTGNDISGEWRLIKRSAYDEYLNLEGWTYVRRGHWPDLDMLQIGPLHGGKELTENEQHFQMSLWVIIPAALMLSCNTTKLTNFHLSLLTNDEVIAVNQDPLGLAAKPVNGNVNILSKQLSDGSHAVGLFNPTDSDLELSVNFDDMGLDGPCLVRDLWDKKDLGEMTRFSTSLEPHCASLLKISPFARSSQLVARNS